MHESKHFLRENNDYDFKYAFDERLLKIESALTSSVKNRPYSVYNLKKLKRFSLNNLYRQDVNLNNLSKYSFENLEELDFNLVSMRIDFNLKELNSNFFDKQPGFSNLKALDLSENNNMSQKWRFGTLKHLSNLKSLNLYRCKMLDLSSLVKCIDLPNLENLNLKWTNDVSKKNHYFDVSFQKFKNLKSINLEKAMVKSINIHVFCGLMKLKELNLKNANIEHIEPESFNDLHQLEVLDLSDNEIEYLDHDLFKSLANLKSLDISNNKLNIIRYDIFGKLNNLQFLKIDHNHIDLNERNMREINKIITLNLTNFEYIPQNQADVPE